MKKWLIPIVIIISAFSLYKYIYQNHRDIANETSSYVITATNLIAEFSINPIDSETKYLNKTIEISGLLTNLSSNNLTINNQVFCLFSNTIQKPLSTNSQIKIKGRFIGYDDLLEEIKLDQCFIIQKKQK